MEEGTQGGKSTPAVICPSCGKNTPRGSKFCLHCGELVSAPVPVPVVVERAPKEWEHDEYVLTWEPGQRPYDEIFRQGETAAKIGFWQVTQKYILPEIQKRLDEGWEPVTEIGPGAFELRYYKSLKGYGCLGWMIFLSIAITTFGLGLLAIPFMLRQWAEVTEFRVQLRRPATPQVPGGDIVGFECDQCFADVPADASVCPNCGVTFEGSDAGEEEEYECDQCGTIVPAGESACPNCGASIERPTAGGRGIEEEYECYQCGAVVPAGALICPTCKAALSDHQPR